MARAANYFRPVQLALRALLDAGIDSYPVSMKRILRHYGIRLMSYEDYCLCSGCALEDCLSLFGRDGATIEQGGKYLIVYNKNQKPKARVRFTLAHELGHILHRHHSELGTELLQRMQVEKSLYDVMEDEANCFARNLLCPALSVQKILRDHGFVIAEPDMAQKRTVWRKIPAAPSLPELPCDLTDSYLVRQSFMVTDAAAKARCHFLKEDLKNTSMAAAAEILDPIRFTAQWRCKKCGAPKKPGSEYCTHCGSRARAGLLVTEAPPEADIPYIYDQYNGKYRVLKCPVCGSADHEPDADYCILCGTNLTNLCAGTRDPETGERIRHSCPPGARYCGLCGKPTAYLKILSLPLRT